MISAEESKCVIHVRHGKNEWRSMFHRICKKCVKKNKKNDEEGIG